MTRKELEALAREKGYGIVEADQLDETGPINYLIWEVDGPPSQPFVINPKTGTELFSTLKDVSDYLQSV